MSSQATAQIEDELLQLETLDLPGLRKLWSSRIGPVPRHISADLFRWRLAYELQAGVHGGLPSVTKRHLERLHQAFTANPQWSPLPYRHLAIGTVLTRDWKGKTHQVTVTDDAYEHQGMLYRSLSE